MLPLPSPPDDGAATRARVKALAREEKNLVAALRSAPSAAETIENELEALAASAKSSSASARLSR